MKKMLLVSFLLFSLFSFSQVYNRTFKFNVGLSHEQFNFENSVNAFNDTSLVNKFNHEYALPTLSVSEGFVLNQFFSISGTLGYQMFNTKYNNSNYGTQLFFASVNPELSVVYRTSYEFYIKLKVGGVYRVSKYQNLPDQTQRFFPINFNVFTGVSGGFNWFLGHHIGVNVELSVWSPEFINCGITYRFFKGKIPTNAEMDDYYID
jgi:hypothetical protein